MEVCQSRRVCMEEGASRAACPGACMLLLGRRMMTLQPIYLASLLRGQGSSRRWRFGCPRGLFEAHGPSGLQCFEHGEGLKEKHEEKGLLGIEELGEKEEHKEKKLEEMRLLETMELEETEEVVEWDPSGYGLVGAQPPTQDVIDAWLKKDLEARTELVRHMGDRQVQLVRQLNTSKEMWDSLQQRYQQTNVVSRVLLHRKLNEVHHKNHNNTEAFLDAWQQANDNLMISGLLLPREIQVTILLAALPDSWQSFISTQSTNAALTINELFALIR
ncbi:hypothetical protein L7F22_025090 [Adiantum nelumboides]|nr:hypothetical protein [Adiantum nelumboides]